MAIIIKQKKKIEPAGPMSPEKVQIKTQEKQIPGSPKMPASILGTIPDYIMPLDIRDIAIIDALPILYFDGSILTVGCGEARVEWYLSQMGYTVKATDIDLKPYPENPNLTFKKLNILEIPTESADVVICSEVLEHLEEYKLAYSHLLGMTRRRLIITVPYEKSFASPDHVNFWGDATVKEFKELAKPYGVTISKIRIKPKDREMNQWAYLIVVDKIQKYEN